MISVIVFLLHFLYVHSHTTHIPFLKIRFTAQDKIMMGMWACPHVKQNILKWDQDPKCGCFQSSQWHNDKYFSFFLLFYNWWIKKNFMYLLRTYKLTQIHPKSILCITLCKYFGAKIYWAKIRQFLIRQNINFHELEPHYALLSSNLHESLPIVSTFEDLHCLYKPCWSFLLWISCFCNNTNLFSHSFSTMLSILDEYLKNS